MTVIQEVFNRLALPPAIYVFRCVQGSTFVAAFPVSICAHDCCVLSAKVFPSTRLVVCNVVPLLLDNRWYKNAVASVRML